MCGFHTKIPIEILQLLQNPGNSVKKPQTCTARYFGDVAQNGLHISVMTGFLTGTGLELGAEWHDALELG